MKLLFKKNIPILLLMLLISVISCQKEKVQGLSKNDFKSPFQLGIAEKTIVSSAEGQITVEALIITDERCTACTSPGSAYVRIIVSNLKDATAEATLMIGDCNGNPRHTDSVDINLKGQFYRIVLQSITHVANVNKAVLIVEKGA